MSQESPEGRNKVVAVAVSAEEEWQIKLVARKTGRSVSSLVREHGLGDLIAWGKRLDDAMNAVAAEVA